MRRFAPLLAPALAVLAASAAPTPATAQTPPAGWKSASLASGGVAYVPPDLNPGEVYSIAVFPPEALAGKPLTDWLTAAARRPGTQPGKSAKPPSLGAASATVATVLGTYAAPSGTPLGAIFIGASADGRRGRFLRVAFSLQKDLVGRYQAELNRMAGEMGAAVKADVGAGSALAPAISPGNATPDSVAPGKATAGGALTPGLYVGQQQYGNDPAKPLRLYLYADGEYRMCDGDDKELNMFGAGQYQYDPRTGKIEIAQNLDLVNSDLGDGSPDRSLYGRDAQGKPFVVGDNDHGFSHVKTLLQYVGPTARPAPQAEAAAKARADAEARRYKYVVAPGKGVADAQIAALIHDYRVETYYGGSGIGTNTTDKAYLLLTDGSVHRGLPVPPDQLDVARSRRMEPQAWGRWQRQGDKYLVSWAGGPLQPLPGRAVLPAPPGTRLAGHWGGGAASSSLAGGSYSLWGVTFTPDGRFVKNESGGYGNSQFMQTGGAPLINSSYDDGGSYTLVAGGNFTALSGHAGTPESHRSGTYAVRGYTMTLRYDDGRVERAPFFFESAARKELSFEGRMVGLDDGK